MLHHFKQLGVLRSADGLKMENYNFGSEGRTGTFELKGTKSRQMRVLKNALIGLGVLFLVVLAFFAWIGVSSSQFRKEEAPFVETFVTDLSKRWDIADV